MALDSMMHLARTSKQQTWSATAQTARKLVKFPTIFRPEAALSSKLWCISISLANPQRFRRNLIKPPRNKHITSLGKQRDNRFEICARCRRYQAIACAHFRCFTYMQSSAGAGENKSLFQRHSSDRRLDGFIYSSLARAMADDNSFRYDWRALRARDFINRLTSFTNTLINNRWTLN